MDRGGGHDEVEGITVFMHVHEGASDYANLTCGVVSQRGLTALIKASFRGHLAVVEALLAAGADVDAGDEVGGDGSEDAK